MCVFLTKYGFTHLSHHQEWEDWKAKLSLDYLGRKQEDDPEYHSTCDCPHIDFISEPQKKETPMVKFVPWLDH